MEAPKLRGTSPSWLPGDDYCVNFHEGDPYIKVDEGYARLPGAGYEALHPELKDINPEDYPDIHNMSILADVAPYSREYHTYRQKVGSQAQGNTELEIEYEKILTRVKKTRESVIRMNGQGSSSRRTQNPSRARQSKTHSLGRMRLLCYLVLYKEDKLEWVLRLAGSKEPHARRKPSSHSPLHHPSGIPVALNMSTGCCRHFRLAGPQTPSLSTPEIPAFPCVPIMGKHFNSASIRPSILVAEFAPKR